jgi:hypothetical protein
MRMLMARVEYEMRHLPMSNSTSLILCPKGVQLVQFGMTAHRPFSPPLYIAAKYSLAHDFDVLIKRKCLKDMLENA